MICLPVYRSYRSRSVNNWFYFTKENDHIQSETNQKYSHITRYFFHSATVSDNSVTDNERNDQPRLDSIKLTQFLQRVSSKAFRIDPDKSSHVREMHVDFIANLFTSDD